jgi:Na+-transporting NADH:ubiquinone oxidoreductase subunit NqrC
MKIIKRIVLILVLSFVCGSAFSQSADKLFDKFKDKPGAQVLNINKSMLSMATSDSTDVQKKKLLENVDSIQILVISKNEATRNDFIKKSGKMKMSDYETLLNVNEDDQVMRIYFRDSNDTNGEFILLVVDKEDCVLIKVLGKIALNDMGEILNFTLSEN